MWNVIKRVKNPNLKRDCPEEKRQRNSLYDQEKWIRTFLESWKAMAAILDRIRSVAEYMQDHDLQLLHDIQYCRVW
jgi:hypothetical protein